MSADDVVRVAIAAPSELACAELEALLASDPNLCVVGTAAATALADLLGRTAPDVLLVDLGAEAAEGLEHVAEGVALPATVVLTSSAHSPHPFLDLGVRAVLPDRPDRRRLAAAIKAVAAGLVVLDEHVAGIEPSSEPEPQGEGARGEALTPREIEVLQLLAEALPNRALAAALGISEHTVKFHLSSIFGKLGATSRTEAVTIGIRRGLVML